MNAVTQTALQATERAEKSLLTELTLKDPTFTSIDHLLSKYRTACENFIFLDFEAASSKKVEEQLWEAHGKINKRFRAQLAKFREGEGKKKPVERRKLEKHYLDFVKSSTRFYRGYIQRLASHFADIPEILQIARKFNLDTLSANEPLQPNEHLRHLLRRSCHSTLIHLGDLSRYRETELQKKERNWGPAKGYYDLATAIDPASGASYNQLAVIALDDGDHLRAVYYLHRALMVEKPFPTAHANLELEFKKVLDRQKKQTLIPLRDAGSPGIGLQAWFVVFHASCYRGYEFKERGDLENEILSQLAVDLKERPLDGTLTKFVLINVAAEHLARQRTTVDQEPTTFSSFYLTFNVKTFSVLLGVFIPEFTNQDEPSADDTMPNNDVEKLTVVARRLLPALRHYSSWLLASCSELLQQSDENIVVEIQQLWKRYAEALTWLTMTFEVTELPSVTYLLEEDLDTVAFKPLITKSSIGRYLQSSGSIKSKIGDAHVQRLRSDEEMLSRVRDFVKEGVQLVLGSEHSTGRVVPIRITETKRFEYQEAGVPPESFPTTQGRSSHVHSHSTTSVTREDIEQAKRQSTTIQADVLETASASVSTNMHQMVDGLVDSETSEHSPPAQRFPQISNGESPPAPTLQYTESLDNIPRTNVQQQKTLTAKDLVSRMQRSPNGSNHEVAIEMERQETLRPVSPSLWNTTPFTPLPGELKTNSPQTRPGTAHKMGSDNFAAVPFSSGSAFQQDMVRRQQQMQEQSTLLQTPLLSSSWSNQASPAANQLPVSVRQQSSPWTGSPIYLSSPYFDYEVPRQSPIPAMFGAIGQTPPSGQAG